MSTSLTTAVAVDQAPGHAARPTVARGDRSLVIWGNRSPAAPAADVRQWWSGTIGSFERAGALDVARAAGAGS